jgi:hypothetical protein
MKSRGCLFRHILWLLLIMGSLTEVGRAQVADEYEVKAAFLYNFTKFVEWPAAAAPSTTFVICILGDDPFESVIDRLTVGKTVNGRALQVRRLKEPDDARQQCQIVFVGASDKSRATKLIETTRGTPVLTVGESRDFVRMGGLFFLSTETGRVSVVISGTATQAAGLKVSAKLMTLATIFKP